MSWNSKKQSSELLLERHFRELSYRFGYWFLRWMVARLVLLYFSEMWLQWFMEPLPEGSSGVFLSLWGNVHSSFKISFTLGILGSLPYLFVQFWWFFASAITSSEQKVRLVFLFQSFSCGCFAFLLWWYYLLPRICTFCLGWSRNREKVGHRLSYLPEVMVYLDLALGRLFALLVSLQLFPLFVRGIALGLWRVKQLGSFRRFAYLALLVFATVVSPPDVGSQIFLAVPLVLCFEASLFVGSFFAWKTIDTIDFELK